MSMTKKKDTSYDVPHPDFDEQTRILLRLKQRIQWVVVIAIILIAAFVILIVPIIIFGPGLTSLETNGVSDDLGNGDSGTHNLGVSVCDDSCQLEIVESIPENLTYPAGSPHHTSTFTGLMSLLQLAETKIDIASYYWTLQRADVQPSDYSADQGEKLFQSLLTSGRDRNISIRIVQNLPTASSSNDTHILSQIAGAQVRSLDFTKIMGRGIIHTKMWLIDDTHFYVGSANLDWRSLTQVKELGVLVTNCSCLARDMKKIFDVYWLLGDTQTLPPVWPSSLTTNINSDTPANLQFNGQPAPTYLTSSPPEFCPAGRTVDIDAILRVIHEAQEFIYIAVMDYIPAALYTQHNIFWPVIDDALRHAIYERHVDVRLLGSHWNHTRPNMVTFLKSLQMINGTGSGHVDVRLFDVPAYTDIQREIPFARVNHNKYMVTEKSAYIGTSNWSQDYFVTTGGVGFIVTQPKHNVSHEGAGYAHIGSGHGQMTVRQHVEDIFLRDWGSQYAHPIHEY